MGNRPMSSVYSLLTVSPTTLSLFNVVAGISMESGDTARVGLDGMVLRLVDCTTLQVCVMWALRVSAVIGW